MTIKEEMLNDSMILTIGWGFVKLDGEGRIFKREGIRKARGRVVSSTEDCIKT